MEVIILWIKYTGKLPYNSMELRGVLPGSRHDIRKSIAEPLIEKRPNWFRPCSAPIVKPKGPKVEVPMKGEPIEKTKVKEEVKKK